jgi:hypothetical protein
MSNKQLDIELVRFLGNPQKFLESNPLVRIEALHSNPINSQLSTLIEQQLKNNQIPVPIKIKQQSLAIRVDYLSKKSFMQRLVKDLNEHKLTIYLLKGMAFNDNIYDASYPRGCSDIDILVLPSELIIFEKILEKYGTRVTHNNKKPFTDSYEHSWVIETDYKIYIDVHWNIMPPGLFDIDIQELTNNSYPHPIYNCKYIRVLANDRNYIHLMLHMFKDANFLHHSLVDSIYLSHKFTNLDWQIIEKNCNKFEPLGITQCFKRTIGIMMDGGKIKEAPIRLLAKNNNLPLKLIKLIISYYFKKNNLTFIGYLFKYVYSYFRARIS